MLLACGVAGLASAAGLAAQGDRHELGTSPYFGRWTVSDHRPVFTARGRPYKTVDFAPCGRDFCGVSVDDQGRCGAVLFRFLMAHVDAADSLRGHGRWGAERKNVLINSYEDTDAPSGRSMELYLGDGYDFGERSDNMPKFHAGYRRTGNAHCAAR